MMSIFVPCLHLRKNNYMPTITKKILPEWFDAIESGKKKYELRIEKKITFVRKVNLFDKLNF